MVTVPHDFIFAFLSPAPSLTHGVATFFCQGLAKGKQDLAEPLCLLSPFPLAGPLVVVGKTALDHIAPPLFARLH
jgi:hypothetical protein